MTDIYTGPSGKAFWDCVAELRQKFPEIKLGRVGGADDDQFIRITEQPELYGSQVRQWVDRHPELIDELWTDFEPSWQKTGLIGPNKSTVLRGINNA